jgi:FkbM family methyltransferase
MDKEQVIKGLNRIYFSSRCHEKEVLNILPSLLKKTKTFVDIGASLGQYTFYANKILKNSNIIAIEADLIRYNELEKNCTNWAKTTTNSIKAIHCAVSNRNGESFFTTGSGISGSFFPRGIPGKDINWKKEEVKCLKLDDLLKDQLPDFIKIDVEGAELKVLKGSSRILKESNVDLLIEMHSFMGDYNKFRLFRFMKSLGYIYKNIFGKYFFTKSKT